MKHKLKLGDYATLEIKEDRVVIKTSKSTLEIYKDGNIKVENRTDKNDKQKSAPVETDAD